MHQLHWLQVTSVDAELGALAEDALLQLHQPCHLGAGEAVCVHGDLRAPNVMVRYRALGLTCMPVPPIVSGSLLPLACKHCLPG